MRRPLKKIIELLEDDVDGGEASATVPFAFNGVQYEIDLSDKNRTRLEKALQPWIDCARKTGGRSRASAQRGPTGVNGHSSREIRDWARTKGLTVPERGRIPNDVRKQFAEEH